MVGRAGCVLVTVPLAVAAGCRLLGLDDRIGWPFPAINAFTPLVYLPAYPVLVVGLARRAPRLTVIAVAVAMLHLYWTVPEFLREGPQLAPAGAWHARVLTANVAGDNREVARLGSQIAAERPDILLLEEYTPLIRSLLAALPELRGYRYAVTRASAEPYGFAVYSRYALAPLPDLVSAGFPFGRLLVSVAPGHRFELVVVHTRSPVGARWTRMWAEQLGALRNVSRSARFPLVMAGDFNANRDHRPFRRLLDTGLRDAHDVSGAGWSPTWSATAWWKLTTRLDHILVSPGIAVTGYHRGGEFGSDHLPVVVDLGT